MKTNHFDVYVILKTYDVEFCSPAGVKLNINPFPPAHR
jgi:hypothetical protein